MLGLLLRLLPIALLLAAPGAHAAISWSVDASVNGSPASGIILPIPGDRIALDITLRSDGEFITALGASAFGYDASVVSLVPEESILPDSVLVAFGIGPGTGFGGLNNTLSPTAVESISPTGVTRTRLFAAVTIGPVANSGELDISPATGLPGGPQFRLVFEMAALGFTTIEIGVDASSPEDGLFFASGAAGTSNNAIVLIGMPEPGTATLIGLGLFGLVHSRASRVVRAGH